MPHLACPQCRKSFAVSRWALFAYSRAPQVACPACGQTVHVPFVPFLVATMATYALVISAGAWLGSGLKADGALGTLDRFMLFAAVLVLVVPAHFAVSHLVYSLTGVFVAPPRR
jgi:hypothetical protein